MNQFGFGGFQVLPPVVKNLLIINVLLFVATISLGGLGINLYDILGLHLIGSEKFQVFQFITYMFMHGDLRHIFFNMFAVWMFGNAIENYWGSKKFLTYYILTGIGAGIIHYLIVYFVDMGPLFGSINDFMATQSPEALDEFVSQFKSSYRGMPAHVESAITSFLAGDTSPKYVGSIVQFMGEVKQYAINNQPGLVGASGSLFGILLAFGMLFPNSEIMLIFIPIPIKAKYFVLGYGLIELVSGLQNNPGDNVAHFAHLGGMLVGFILIKFWQRNNKFYQ